MSADSFIVYVPSQYARGSEPDFKAAVQEATIANAKRVLVWPFPVPHYGKGEADDKIRNSRRGQAMTDAQGIFRDAAAHVANGLRMRVWVGSGIVMTENLTDPDPKARTYSNVTGREFLTELALNADEVFISAGAEDPREYGE